MPNDNFWSREGQDQRSNQSQTRDVSPSCGKAKRHGFDVDPQTYQYARQQKEKRQLSSFPAGWLQR